LLYLVKLEFSVSSPTFAKTFSLAVTSLQIMSKMKLLNFSITILFFLLCFSCIDKKKNSNEPLELTLNLSPNKLTVKNNDTIREYRPDKIGYRVKLEIKNVSNKNFKFDMWTCSFGSFLVTNSKKLQILSVLRCDSNFPGEVELKPNEKLNYKFLILKDKNELEKIEQAKVGLIVIHSDWKKDESVFDQIEKQKNSRKRKIFWSNAVHIDK